MAKKPSTQKATLEAFEINFPDTALDKIMVLFDSYARLAYEQMLTTEKEPGGGFDGPFVLPEQKEIYLDEVKRILKNAITPA